MMRTMIVSLFVGALLSTSCGNNEKREENSDTSTQEPIDKEIVSDEKPAANGIDIDAIPITDKLTGVFPYVNLPEGTQPLNKPLTRDYDEVYFPVGDSLFLAKGKVYKSFVTNTKDSEWSEAFFRKSFDEAVKAVGGVEVFKGKLTREQRDFIQDNALNLGEEGSIDYSETVSSYIVRTADALIYIQLSAYSSGGSVQILKDESRTD